MIDGRFTGLGKEQDIEDTRRQVEEEKSMMTYEKNPEGHTRGWEQHALPGKGERSRSGAHSLRELKTDHVRPCTWKRNGEKKRLCRAG